MALTHAASTQATASGETKERKINVAAQMRLVDDIKLDIPVLCDAFRRRILLIGLSQEARIASLQAWSNDNGNRDALYSQLKGLARPRVKNGEVVAITDIALQQLSAALAEVEDFEVELILNDAARQFCNRLTHYQGVLIRYQQYANEAKGLLNNIKNSKREQAASARAWDDMQEAVYSHLPWYESMGKTRAYKNAAYKFMKFLIIGGLISAAFGQKDLVVLFMGAFILCGIATGLNRSLSNTTVYKLTAGKTMPEVTADKQKLENVLYNSLIYFIQNRPRNEVECLYADLAKLLPSGVASFELQEEVRKERVVKRRHLPSPPESEQQQQPTSANNDNRAQILEDNETGSFYIPLNENRGHARMHIEQLGSLFDSKDEGSTNRVVSGAITKLKHERKLDKLEHTETVGRKAEFRGLDKKLRISVEGHLFRLGFKTRARTAGEERLGVSGEVHSPRKFVKH